MNKRTYSLGSSSVCSTLLRDSIKTNFL
jgi:hypothetical protein